MGPGPAGFVPGPDSPGSGPAGPDVRVRSGRIWKRPIRLIPIVCYITFSLPCSTAWPLFCSLKVLPLEIMIKIEWGKTMYKFQNKMLPLAFENYFSKPNHQHGTRFATSLNFEFVRANSSRDESMLRIIGPKAWVGVPLKIKKSLSLKIFIKEYRSFLIELENQDLE